MNTSNIAAKFRTLSTVLAILCLGPVALPACDSRAGEADLEEERTNLLVWSFLLNPALTDFATACTNATTAGLSCATTAGNAGLYATGYLSARFSVADTSNSAGICADYPEAGILLNYSQAAKVCWFSCETSYWSAGQFGGNCTGANFGTYAAGAFTAITGCADACRTNGTFFIF